MWTKERILLIRTMGKCFNCGTEVTLKDEEVRCDNCGEVLRYWCNNCATPFDILNEDTKEKVKMCSVCGYFYCPACGVCGEHCDKSNWHSSLKEIFPNATEEQLKKCISFIENLKFGKEHKNCPFGVPISYAKGKIKFAAAKTQGYDLRNEQEKLLFEKRLQEIKNIPTEKEFTIGDVREDGVYGQEYRDVCNYCVCLGVLKVEHKINNKTNKEYSLFKKIEDVACKKLNLKDIVIENWCPQCKKQNCGGIYKKGKIKGQQHKLIKKLTNEDICQLERGAFKKDGRRIN